MPARTEKLSPGAGPREIAETRADGFPAPGDSISTQRPASHGSSPGTCFGGANRSRTDAAAKADRCVTPAELVRTVAQDLHRKLFIPTWIAYVPLWTVMAGAVFVFSIRRTVRKYAFWGQVASNRHQD